MKPALRTSNLTMRYGATTALDACSLDLPPGRIAALVGPNGAGKTTLLQLAAGLLTPSAGHVEVFGWSPQEHPAMVLPRIGFLGQDRPLFRGFTVKETMEMGRRLNPRWDQELALERLSRLEIPLDRRIRKLSGGQQAQVALVLALAKRPELLLLDEPVSALDPVARQEFMRTLIDATAEHGLTVLLSSHIIGDLERVCDYLIVLAGARVALAGDLDQVVAAHRLVIGPTEAADACRHLHDVVREERTGRQATLLVRLNGQMFSRSCQVREASLEDIVFGYLDARTAST
ncbi:MAG: ABC transporter ATP-binding protein, partial [Chloroflexota bacterium]|nr:ABC transporter ATP-binding protein [Chloroflexota bacterium]